MDKIEQPEGSFSHQVATDDVTSGGGGGRDDQENGTPHQAVDKNDDEDVMEPSSLYDHMALDLSGYDTVDLNPVDDAAMNTNDGVADHPLSSLSSPSRQLPDNGGNGGDTSKPTTPGRTSRKGRALRPVKDTIKAAPPKKRLRKSSSTNPQSTGSSTASKPSPVPPPQPPPEVYYPHLATPQPPSLLTDTTILQRRRMRWKQLADAEGDPVPPTEICGLPVPKKRHDACATCGMTGEDGGNKILLCDGPNCGQEYHMNCCIPPVQRIPTGKFYCFDCNSSGTSVHLAEYFQQHEERKDEHERFCLQQLAITSNASTPTSSKKRKKTTVVVHSFIDTLLQDDVTAESTETNPLTTGSTSTTVIKAKTLGGRRSRGTDNEDDAVLLPISELKHIHHEHLIGKPVRLYCPNMNAYHNGRILDTRSADDTSVALVRFPAGKDHRKTTLTKWIHLEEHSLAVASDLVWAWMRNTTSNTKKRSSEEEQWTLGKLWRRTGRELVPVMKQLNEAEGQIRFRPLKEPTDALNDTASNTGEVEKDEIMSNADNDNTTTTSGTTLAPIVPRWGLVESFDGTYQFLNLEEETRLEPPSSGPKVNDPIISGLAKVERQEQRCIQWWKALPLHNPFLALRAQDPAAPSLEFEIPVEKECVRPSSLVDLGLDREMMVKLVAQHLGMEPTKDLGVGLACETVDCLASMIQSLTPRL